MRAARMRLLASLLSLGLGLACSGGPAPEAQPDVSRSTAALFAFAPRETELALALRDLELLRKGAVGALRVLSEVPSVRSLWEEIERFGEDKLGKDPFDDAFLTSLHLAADRGAALFLVDRGGKSTPLYVFAVLEQEAFLAAARYQGRIFLGEDLSIERRAQEGATIYDVSAPGTRLPNLVAAFKDGYVLVSESEELVKGAVSASDGAFWAQVQQRSPLAREPHDALAYLSFDGRAGEELRRDYGTGTLSGEFVKSWTSLSLSLSLEGEVIRARGFLSTPQARDLKPYLERSGGRGDLLAIAGPETASALRLSLNPKRIWQKLSELPSSSGSSPARLAELFQSLTAVRLSDEEDGVLENLTGELAYISGPGLVDFALLLGVQKPEPFEKLLAAGWSMLQGAVAGARPELERQRLELKLSEPREEGGREVYHLELRHLDIPIPLVLEAGTTSDALVLSVGEGWLDRASSRAGKSARSYYKHLYHPEVREILASAPPIVAYVQFLDPAEGLESTPGEVAQTLAAYAQSPSLGEALTAVRAIVARLYDGTFAFFVRDDGLELVARITTL